MSILLVRLLGSVSQLKIRLTTLFESEYERSSEWCIQGVGNDDQDQNFQSRCEAVRDELWIEEKGIFCQVHKKPALHCERVKLRHKGENATSELIPILNTTAC
jgi:hypothetical protein